jgi:hypothetical protein
MFHRDAEVEQAGGKYVQVPFQQAIHSSLEPNFIRRALDFEAVKVGHVDIVFRKATQEISSV